ncbi:hypothetical protein GE09DRAFT_1218538 [Coniochaeta sp. 2T2.1]|nr:hypothetical protein GE09DRAFT_1218538 [Coniochaeta sp. 2T2.1]
MSSYHAKLDLTRMEIKYLISLSHIDPEKTMELFNRRYEAFVGRPINEAEVWYTTSKYTPRNWDDWEPLIVKHTETEVFDWASMDIGSNDTVIEAEYTTPWPTDVETMGDNTLMSAAPEMEEPTPPTNAMQTKHATLLMPAMEMNDAANTTTATSKTDDKTFPPETSPMTPLEDTDVVEEDGDTSVATVVRHNVHYEASEAGDSDDCMEPDDVDAASDWAFMEEGDPDWVVL